MQLNNNLILLNFSDYFQVDLTIHINTPHNDFQKQLNQDDRAKVRAEFNAGIERLNEEFIKLKWPPIELTNDEIDCLVGLYVNQSVKNETSGSHYRLVGPFIIPSERQQLNMALIADRWVALSAFQRLYSPIE